MRTFDTGATRDADTNKIDYEGFYSPIVVRRFGAYMHQHRIQTDGGLRASDNWQKGIPLDAYMKSAWRHFLDWWALHRMASSSPLGVDTSALLQQQEEAICALLFNAQGYLHERLR